MIFAELELRGAYLIESEPILDERGSFARTFCTDEFALRGLVTTIAQCSSSRSARAGTLRGLHYQAQPFGETKLIRCAKGAIFDVIVDIRPESESYGRWTAVNLTAESGRMLYVPQGFAHGFQTLEDDTEVCYQISTPYVPELARGICWNDPALGIAWPIAGPILSPRDRALPLLPARQLAAA